MTRSRMPAHAVAEAPGWRPDASLHVILAPLAKAHGLLLAVSGGPDSTALLLMAAHWVRLRGSPRLEAATVDHGLRPESAREAAAVAKLCESLGVPHHTLVWSRPKPKTRLQERARDARYALLAERAKEIGADFIVTAHHLDDQAETVLFRLIRGTGIGGLAGMPAQSTRDGVTLARPLLGLSKAELIAYCEAEDVDYVRDASNEDPRFARTRMRALLKSLEAEGLDAPALSRLARRAARVEEALERQTFAVESRIRLFESGGCDAAKLFAEPTEIVQRLLNLTIARVGRHDAKRIGLEKIETLTAGLHEAWLGRERFSANVAGAHVTCDAKGAVRVEREPPRGRERIRME
jgi:tRNA(Ile)-lysidine synthase